MGQKKAEHRNGDFGFMHFFHSLGSRLVPKKFRVSVRALPEWGLGYLLYVIYIYEGVGIIFYVYFILAPSE